MRTTIKEKSCKVLVDIEDVPNRDQEVFYNPKMELNRSLSILLLQALDNKDMQFALPLAGSGVRAVRFLKELPQDMIKHIHVNDLSESAFSLIKKNIKLNNLESDNVKVFNKDANKFLEDSLGFDYIDIDPFGSPNFLLDLSMRRISRRGILAVTATDTAALAGSFPSAGKMKYWANTAIIPQKHEIGLRILARKVILMGMQTQKALKPIFSYHHEHYYRIFFEVTKGKTVASQMFDKTNTWYHVCKHCGFATSSNKQLINCSECGNKFIIVGPCYDGSLQKKEVLAKMININDDKKIERRLTKLFNEAKVNIVGFFDSHIVCEKHGGEAPKVNYLVEQLESKGFQASQSSNELTGVKTTASYKEFLELFNQKHRHE